MSDTSLQEIAKIADRFEADPDSAGGAGAGIAWHSASHTDVGRVRRGAELGVSEVLVFDAERSQAPAVRLDRLDPDFRFTRALLELRVEGQDGVEHDDPQNDRTKLFLSQILSH